MQIKQVGLILGGGLFISILLFCHLGENPATTRMASVAVLMSVFWVTEAIPLAATALLPLALFPVLGIASSKQVAGQYMNSTVFLLIGGFLIALAMQRWNLHKRIALNVLCHFGGTPGLVLLGFILVTAFLSMWISNTATTLMMLPIALAVLSRYEAMLPEQQVRQYTVAMLLSIAYSASIGGMMTLVGTAPNLVFANFYQNITGQSIGFAQWMLISMPVGMAMLVALSFLINVIYLRSLTAATDLNAIVKNEKASLGIMRYEEKAVFILFVVTALLWVTRKGLSIGDMQLLGWSSYLAVGKLIDDGSVAIVMASIMFLIPAQDINGRKTTLLDDSVFAELPWSIVVLFGGGFALAYGFTESGLSTYLSSHLHILESSGLSIVVFVITVLMSLLTELTSNTATTQLVLPVLSSTAEVIGVSPVMLMYPATLAASCAFMFPVATPPNAIIFGSGKIRVIDMVSFGVVLNIVAIFLISFLGSWLIQKMLNL